MGLERDRTEGYSEFFGRIVSRNHCANGGRHRPTLPAKKNPQDQLHPATWLPTPRARSAGMSCPSVGQCVTPNLDARRDLTTSIDSGQEWQAGEDSVCRREKCYGSAFWGSDPQPIYLSPRESSRVPTSGFLEFCHDASMFEGLE